MREILKIKCIMLILHDTLIKFDSINYTKQPPENLENSNMILFTLNTSSGYEESSFTYLSIKIVKNFQKLDSPSTTF